MMLGSFFKSAYENLILEFLWNHTWQNSQVRHDRCGSITITEKFYLESSKLLLDLSLGENMIFLHLASPEMYCRIYIYPLQYLFVRRSNKQQIRGGIIPSFIKGGTFFMSYKNQVLLGLISRCSLILSPSKKGLPFLFS